MIYNTHEPGHDKTNNLGFPPAQTQTELYSHRSNLKSHTTGDAQYQIYDPGLSGKWLKLFTTEVSNIFNPLLTNGFTYYYHLDESTFIVRGVRNFFFIFYLIFQ